jgi:UDP-N-acetylmuramate--alanine ligase
VIVGVDDMGSHKILEKIRRPLLTYGLAPDADIQARDIRGVGRPRCFRCLSPWQKVGGHPLERRGPAQRHQLVGGGGGGVGTGHPLSPKLRKPWRRLKGVGRRLEWKGERGGVAVMDDYGHHPTEIKATFRR